MGDRNTFVKCSLVAHCTHLVQQFVKGYVPDVIKTCRSTALIQASQDTYVFPNAPRQRIASNHCSVGGRTEALKLKKLNCNLFCSQYAALCSLYNIHGQRKHVLVPSNNQATIVQKAGSKKSDSV